MADRWDREYRERDLDYERNRGYGRSDYERDRSYDRNRGYGRDEERGWFGRAVDKVRDAFTADEERERYRSDDRDFYPDRHGREYDRYDRERRYGSGASYGGGMFGTAGYGPSYGVGGGLGSGARGNYAGRGPKGYKRSDERISEDVCDVLTQHPDVDASDISIRVEAGSLPWPARWTTGTRSAPQKTPPMAFGASLTCGTKSAS